MLDRRYQTFLTLVQTNSYTKTAEKLFITQPAVTQQITSLQNELKIELVHYDRPNLVITTAGKQLASFIEEVTIQSNAVLDHIKHPSIKRDLHFGATLSFNHIVEPDLIQSIQDQFANISCIVANTDEILDQISHGGIEFGLVEGNFDLSKFEHLTIYNDNFVAVCHPDNPLAQKPAVSLTDCLKYPLLLREKGSGTRAILEDWLGTQNYNTADFRRVITVGDMLTIIKMLTANMGISFLYRSLVSNNLDNRTLIQLPVTDFNIERELSMVFLHHSFYESQYHALAAQIHHTLMSK